MATTLSTYYAGTLFHGKPRLPLRDRASQCMMKPPRRQSRPTGRSGLCAEYGAGAAANASCGACQSCEGASASTTAPAIVEEDVDGGLPSEEGPGVEDDTVDCDWAERGSSDDDAADYPDGRVPDATAPQARAAVRPTLAE